MRKIFVFFVAFFILTGLLLGSNLFITQVNAKDCNSSCKNGWHLEQTAACVDAAGTTGPGSVCVKDSTDGGGGSGKGNDCCGQNGSGQSSQCAPGFHCDQNLTGRCPVGECVENIGGGGGTNDGKSTNVKCNCTDAFSACEDKFGKTNIKWRQCKKKATGTETCNWRVKLKYYQYEECDAGPTATPGGPTPTVNPNCSCTSGSCTSACTFEGVSDASSIKCGLAGDLFQSAPTDTDKTGWCQRPKRTKGDANGDGALTDLDYMYYVSAVNGGKIPAVVNPDFNGDGEVGAADRTIIIGSL